MEPVVVNIGNDYIPESAGHILRRSFPICRRTITTGGRNRARCQIGRAAGRRGNSGDPVRRRPSIHRRMLTTVTDQQGHYRLDGMPKGEGNRLLAVPNDDQPYFLREFDVPSGPELQTVKFDLELHRGNWVKGRVDETSRLNGPVLAYVRYVPWPDNPRVKQWPELRALRNWREHFQTDRRGNYQDCLAPGRGLVVRVDCKRTAFPSVQGLREIADLPDEQQFRIVGGRPRRWRCHRGEGNSHRRQSAGDEG